MVFGIQAPKRRFQFSLRTLLLLFIPVALLTALAIWLFFPPAIDVSITVERFFWQEDTQGNTVGLWAKVRITNRSRHTVWYMNNPRCCMLELVDGQMLGRSWGYGPVPIPGEAEKDRWSAQDGSESITTSIGPISEKATMMHVVVAFTTDRFMPKRHWVSSPAVRIVKKGKDFFPKVEKGADSTQSLDAPVLISRDFEERKKRRERNR